MDTFEINPFISIYQIPKKSPVGGDGEKLIDYGMICSLVSSRTGATLRGKSAGKMEKTWRFRLKSPGIEEREKR